MRLELPFKISCTGFIFAQRLLNAALKLQYIFLQVIFRPHIQELPIVRELFRCELNLFPLLHPWIDP
jgi:hypothetical protein